MISKSKILGAVLIGGLWLIAPGSASAQTGKCCQLDPGPTICGTCTQEQCGGSGGCSNCNSTSVFQTEPGFSACKGKARPKMCKWDLYKRECAEYNVPEPGKAGHKGQSTIGGKPAKGGIGGDACIKWQSVYQKTQTIPCDQSLQSNDPEYTWVQQPNP